MIITGIRTYNFRNLEDMRLSIDNGQSIFVGNNGQGKTNLLEAIFFGCYGSSFRSNKAQEMIRHGEREGAVELFLDDNGEHHTILCKMGKKREILLDGKPLKDRKELLYLLPCIVFTHEDIYFITGPPEAQRRYFDQTLVLYDPNLTDNLRSYKRILRQRNSAIKDNYLTLLPVYNEQLAQLGIAIQKERFKLVERFNQIFPEVYGKVSRLEDPVTIDYMPSWPCSSDPNEIITLLEGHLQRDIIMRTTTSGPHRDRFVFRYQGKDFSTYASMGQSRLMALVVKLTQCILLEEHRSVETIGLFDDVFLELDHDKRGRFLESIPNFRQSFYTFLPEEKYFKGETEDIGVFQLSQGKVRVE